MDLQSKINLVKGRIKQISESSLFTDTEKETLLKANNKELEIYQSQLATLCLESASKAIDEAVIIASKMNQEFKNTSV